MISVEEARERILSRVTVLGAERIELRSALHRVLAEDIVVPFDMPPWPNSSMDGYALRSDDTSTASHSAPTRLVVAGRVHAGAIAAQPLGPGEAFRIFTGAPLPEGADSVIPQEEVSADGDCVRIERPVRRGEFVRPRGEDVKAGELALSPGRVLGAPEIGLLATFGRAQLNVVKRPQVAIVSTGDELVDLGGTLGPGQIPNSNTYSLMAQVVDAGARPVNLGVARDRLEEIRTRLGWGLACDALISSAGVSVGEHDYVKAALERLGAEQHLWLVDMRPGKPIAFATIPAGLKGVVPVFALPGNPVSAMVTFELFVRPALLRMAGHARVDRPIVNARALARIENPGRRRGYLRVTLQQTADGIGAQLTGDQSSGILRSMVDADGLAIVPGDTAIEAGDHVRVLLLRAIDQLDVPTLPL